MQARIPIVIASVLKPVNDSRSLFKLGFSLRETNKYDLNIIGFSAKKIPIFENINFITIFSKRRMHPMRLWAPFIFVKNLFKICPKVVIITTFELLPAAVMGKFFLGYHLIYDVQENHALNIRYNKSQPFLLRFLTLAYVRFCEGLAHQFIDHYLYAERAYVHQFPKIDNYTIIENKANLPGQFKPAFKIKKDAPLSLLITGTIAEAYGIWEAIHWFSQISGLHKDLVLEIKGHVPLDDLYDKLWEINEKKENLRLFLSKKPIDSDIINEWMAKADILLLPYQLLPSTEDKIPTKLYEGIALQKPILISRNPVWDELVDRYPAGKGIDFQDSKAIISEWNTFLDMEFYCQKPGAEVDWQTEKERFLQLLQHLTEK